MTGTPCRNVCACMCISACAQFRGANFAGSDEFPCFVNNILRYFLKAARCVFEHSKYMHTVSKRRAQWFKVYTRSYINENENKNKTKSKYIFASSVGRTNGAYVIGLLYCSVRENGYIDSGENAIFNSLGVGVCSVLSMRRRFIFATLHSQ